MTTSVSGGHPSATYSRKIETDGVTETKGDFIQDYCNRSQSGCIKRDNGLYFSEKAGEFLSSGVSWGESPGRPGVELGSMIRLCPPTDTGR